MKRLLVIQNPYAKWSKMQLFISPNTTCINIVTCIDLFVHVVSLGVEFKQQVLFYHEIEEQTQTDNGQQHGKGRKIEHSDENRIQINCVFGSGVKYGTGQRLVHVDLKKFPF